jgi:hypothetical protein
MALRNIVIYWCLKMDSRLKMDPDKTVETLLLLVLLYESTSEMSRAWPHCITTSVEWPPSDHTIKSYTQITHRVHASLMVSAHFEQFSIPVVGFAADKIELGSFLG